jgi:hypothetical protein
MTGNPKRLKMSKLPKLQVESFTVSYAFDTHLNGKKANHFVSVGFTTSEPVSTEEAQVLQVKGSQMVTIAAIHDAVARGAISIEEARDLIADVKLRHEGLAGKLSEDLNSGV